MKKILIVLLFVAVVSMCGCTEVPYVDDGEIIDEYNEYIDTWNRDVGTYNSHMNAFNAALDDYNAEIEIYILSGLWNNW